MQLRHLLVAALALAGCKKPDPLYCDNNPDDSRCTGDAGVTDANGVTIGGKVNGLTGFGLVLQNNGGDDKQIVNSGPFAFPTPVPVDSTYDVAVSVQPTNPSQDCVVSNGTGTATGALVDSVAVDCTTATYYLGGTVVGLATGTVTLAFGGQTVTTGNGAFMFPTKIASGTMYDVTLSNAPSTCHIFGNTGQIGNADVTTVVVNCVAGAYTIGGTVTGLNGTVTLTDNGGDMISVSANGSYAFPTPIATNGGYSVMVATQPAYPPAKQTCLVSNGSGTVGVSPVTNVDVTCTTDTFHVSGSSTGVTGTIALQNNLTDTIMQSTSGAFMFPTALASGSPYAVTVSQTPVMLGCTVANASGTLTTMDISNVSVSCSYKDGGIKCGGTYCAAGGGAGCCDPEGTAMCASSASSCSGKLYLPCDSNADCGGTAKCCVTLAGNQNHPSVSSVSCTGSCSGPVLCDPNAPKCPHSTSCKPYGLLPGYDACQ